MAKPLQGRHGGEIEGDFVVFLIGTRPDLRRPLRWWRDIGGQRGMVHMLKYLADRPEKGLLGYELGFPVIVQYWRSYEHLEAFARDDSDPHLAPMRNYWRRVGRDNRSGIWHETFLVRDGEYEAIYANMPPFGVGRAGKLSGLPASSRARTRIASSQLTTPRATPLASGSGVPQQPSPS